MAPPPASTSEGAGEKPGPAAPAVPAVQYECGECGTSFCWSSRLLFQQRSHRVQRPYKCPDLPKAFKNFSVQLQPVAGQLSGSGGAALTTEAPNLLVVRSGASEELLTGPGPGEVGDAEAGTGVVRDFLFKRLQKAGGLQSVLLLSQANGEQTPLWVQEVDTPAPGPPGQKLLTIRSAPAKELLESSGASEGAATLQLLAPPPPPPGPVAARAGLPAAPRPRWYKWSLRNCAQRRDPAGPALHPDPADCRAYGPAWLIKTADL